MAISRISLAPALLLAALGACDGAPDGDRESSVPVACALQGAGEFASRCSLVRMGEGEDRAIVMRHPDGGFRKLAPADTPAGLVERDGAQRAMSWREGNAIVLQIGDDRYRWEAASDD